MCHLISSRLKRAVSSRCVTSTQLTTDLIAPGRSLGATRVELNLNFQTTKNITFYALISICFVICEQAFGLGRLLFTINIQFIIISRLCFVKILLLNLKS